MMDGLRKPRKGIEMPELPDVEVFREYFNSTALHQKIVEIRVEHNKVLEAISGRRLKDALSGRSFETTDRRGKYLFAQTDDDVVLVLHFGMTGYLLYAKSPGPEDEHIRVLFSFENDYNLGYVCQRLLGKVAVTDSVKDFVASRQLGPDALDISLEDFKQVLKDARGSLKSTLMNQSRLAGLGNVYTDEVLFHARLHPATTAGDLSESDLKKLHRNMQKVLNKTIEKQADPAGMPRSYMLPHRGRDGSCPRCKRNLETMKVSGRKTYFCPKCQPAP